MTIRCLIALVALLTWGGLVQAAGSAAGATSPEIVRPAAKSIEDIAATSYRAGMKHKKKAWKYEARAAAASNEEKRDKLLAKAGKEYAAAIKDQSKALQALPSYYEAASELGYALRKTGDYRKSIGAYNYALGINPNYHEALEYRGEAFLALGYLDEAKQDYMKLFRGDRELAAQLLAAMEAWAAEQESAAATSEFTAWVEERKELAQISADLSLNSPRSW